METAVLPEVKKTSVNELKENPCQWVEYGKDIHLMYIPSSDPDDKRCLLKLRYQFAEVDFIIKGESILFSRDICGSDKRFDELIGRKIEKVYLNMPTERRHLIFRVAGDIYSMLYPKFYFNAFKLQEMKPEKARKINAKKSYIRRRIYRALRDSFNLLWDRSEKEDLAFTKTINIACARKSKFHMVSWTQDPMLWEDLIKYPAARFFFIEQGRIDRNWRMGYYCAGYKPSKEYSLKTMEMVICNSANYRGITLPHVDKIPKFYNFAIDATPVFSSYDTVHTLCSVHLTRPVTKQLEYKFISMFAMHCKKAGKRDIASLKDIYKFLDNEEKDYQEFIKTEMPEEVELANAYHQKWRYHVIDDAQIFLIKNKFVLPSSILNATVDDIKKLRKKMVKDANLAEHLSLRKSVTIENMTRFLYDYVYCNNVTYRRSMRTKSLLALYDLSKRWHDAKQRILRDRVRRHNELYAYERMAYKHESVYENAHLAIPPVPLDTLPEGITFINTQGKLMAEGDDMNHCINDYSTKCVEGLYYCFHIEHKGYKASLQLNWKGELIQANGPGNRHNIAAEYGKKAMQQWAKNITAPPIIVDPAAKKYTDDLENAKPYYETKKFYFESKLKSMQKEDFNPRTWEHEFETYKSNLRNQENPPIMNPEAM